MEEEEDEDIVRTFMAECRKALIPTSAEQRIQQSDKADRADLVWIPGGLPQITLREGL